MRWWRAFRITDPALGQLGIITCQHSEMFRNLTTLKCLDEEIAGEEEHAAISTIRAKTSDRRTLLTSQSQFVQWDGLNSLTKSSGHV